MHYGMNPWVFLALVVGVSIAYTAFGVSVILWLERKSAAKSGPKKGSASPFRR